MRTVRSLRANRRSLAGAVEIVDSVLADRMETGAPAR